MKSTQSTSACTCILALIPNIFLQHIYSSTGDGIQPDVYTIHSDISLWGPVDPKIFYPARFRTKRHPMAWLPFGAGPRTCVGIKLALTEIKIVLINLLRLYRIQLKFDNDQPLNIKESFVLIPNELHIHLYQRCA